MCCWQIETFVIGPCWPSVCSKWLDLRHKARACQPVLSQAWRGFQEPLPVLIVLEDWFAAVALMHDAVEDARVLKSQSAWHKHDNTKEWPSVNSFDRPLCDPCLCLA